MGISKSISGTGFEYCNQGLGFFFSYRLARTTMSTHLAHRLSWRSLSEVIPKEHTRGKGSKRLERSDPRRSRSSIILRGVSQTRWRSSQSPTGLPTKKREEQVRP